MREIADYQPTRGSKRYYWEEWADGRWKLAEKGVDFNHAPTFRVALSQWAQVNQRMYKTETTPTGDIAFIIYPRD